MMRPTIVSQTVALLLAVLLVGAGSRTITHAATLPSGVCVGDCDHDHTVTIDELEKGINIALSDLSIDVCPAFDSDSDARVSVDELIKAVNNALDGCPVVATLTPDGATTTPTPSTPAATPTPVSTAVRFCDLPGSVQTTANGLVVVAGGPAGTPDLSFLHLPIGFCAHFFANIGNARQLRFAPGGELFVASPTTATSGGGPGGRAAIMVLPDNDHDGVADVPGTFLSGLPSTQGMLFTGGYFYYQDGTTIRRVPYTPGDRSASGSSEQIADITIYISTLHWPKALDVADDGTIYVTNGGDQNEPCDPAHPFHGGILKLDQSPGGSPVAKGFRNPISLRCSRGHNLCYAVELTRDFTATQGGREKLVPIRQGDDWGFPCCATTDLPFPDISPVPDCSTVASDSNSFIVGHTPFDLDFEPGRWPPPWNHRVYVPLHGAAGTWEGARVVAIAVDPATGEVLPGSELAPGANGALSEFASGWDDRTLSHGRPAAVAFAPDGRLFLGNDNTGDIIWIAPTGL